MHKFKDIPELTKYTWKEVLLGGYCVAYRYFPKKGYTFQVWFEKKDDTYFWIGVFRGSKEPSKKGADLCHKEWTFESKTLEQAMDAANEWWELQ